MKKLFGTNGIRGILNEKITPEFSLRMGRAIGTVFGQRKKDKGVQLGVGMDGRKGNLMVKNALIGGLLATGVDVSDVGLVPTPTLQYIVKTTTLEGGVMVTASHNPPEYNGIKLVDSDGIETAPETEAHVEHVYFGQAFSRAPWDGIGQAARAEMDVCKVFVQAVLSHVDHEAIRARHLKVVYDPGHGVGHLTVVPLLEQLGCEVVEINGTIDGTFPGRRSEPTPETLARAAEVVVEEEADFGIGTDGDGDRGMLIDPTGKVLWGDQSFALILRDLLPRQAGTVVTPVSSSSLIKQVTDEHGAELVWTPVGCIHVSRKMVELDALIGGEENGGIFYPPHQYVRDATLMAALVCQAVAAAPEPKEVLLDPALQCHLAKRTVRVPPDRKAEILQAVIEETRDHEQLTLDGVKVFTDAGAVLIRPSGTEPIFRSFSDGKDQATADKLADWGIELVTKNL